MGREEGVVEGSRVCGMLEAPSEVTRGKADVTWDGHRGPVLFITFPKPVSKAPRPADMGKSTKKSEPLVPAEGDLEGSAEVKVSKNRFGSVPPETWLLAFRYLSRKDHLQLLLVSSFFRQLAEQYVYERIVAKFTHEQLAYQRSLACLQSIKSRPQAAAAVRWLEITVPEGGANNGLPLELIKDVLASVEKLHFLRLYGLGEILPKDLKKGCLQYLKAYRGSPGSLADRGELPSVVELGYFEDGRLWKSEPSVPVLWPEIIRGLPINFPSLKTLSLGRFKEINDASAPHFCHLPY